MLTAGVDIGARTIDIAFFDGTQMLASSVSLTGVNPSENASSAFEKLRNTSGISSSDIKRIIATGYGRNYFRSADRVASEIICHAAGVYNIVPNVHTIIDIGGQDSKVIFLGDNGKVLDFVMNDRCAAGTGKFIEVTADSLNIPLEETGESSLKTTETYEISSMCVVFAESEIIGLLHKGVDRNAILRGVFRSIAKRITGMAERSGLKEDIVFTGGVAHNEGVLEALKQHTGRSNILVPPDPQITGALGAAIIAYEELTGFEEHNKS